jgi:predicted nucleotidyltransferase
MITSSAPPINKKRQRLLQKELARWKPLLIQHFNPEKIILFGSLPNQTVHEWSDVDLVIIQQTDLPFTKRIRQALLLLQPKVGVDLLIYTPEEFEQMSMERRFVQNEILKKGEVIYERR